MISILSNRFPFTLPARRIKETYPEFFDLNRTNLTLYTTYKPRTNETAYAFFDEIFEKNYSE